MEKERERGIEEKGERPRERGKNGVQRPSVRPSIRPFVPPRRKTSSSSSRFCLRLSPTRVSTRPRLCSPVRASSWRRPPRARSAPVKIRWRNQLTDLSGAREMFYDGRGAPTASRLDIFLRRSVQTSLCRAEWRIISRNSLEFGRVSVQVLSVSEINRLDITCSYKTIFWDSEMYRCNGISA